MGELRRRLASVLRDTEASDAEHARPLDAEQTPALARETTKDAATPGTSMASGEPDRRRAEIDWRD